MSKCSDSKNTSSTNKSADKNSALTSSSSTVPSHCDHSSKQAAALACCDKSKASIDWILWGCGSTILVLSVMYGLIQLGWVHNEPVWLKTMATTSVEMVHAMWWGLILGAFFVGVLNKVPQGILLRILGQGGKPQGVFRATLAGVLLDLCNHGILMVAMQLYRKGASLGQVMAFLIASPWNSLTLTLILIGLIGLPLTLLFIGLSMLIAIVSGLLFDRWVDKGLLPANPVSFGQVEPIALKAAFAMIQPKRDLRPQALGALAWEGFKASTMVVRWVAFGILLIALVRALVPEDAFSAWFGASFLGVMATLLAATLLEVCSEGSSPIAADLVNRAGAPGNGFVFLMAGASTDYTEIMAIKDTMASWKIALCLPLITIPQVVLVGWLLNLA